jgi:competence protein ComEC
MLRIPRKARHFLVIAALIFYCFITGASTPVVRATVMGVFLILGYILRREPNITNSFSLAVLFILFVDPKALFSISFQLSYISVAAIVYLYPRLRSCLRLERIKIKLLKLIFDGCLVSFSAWLGTMGFIAYYFKIFSPVTLLANIFVVPLATLITLSGLSMVAVALISPFLAGPLASTNEILVIILLKLNTFFINLPLAYLHL